MSRNSPNCSRIFTNAEVAAAASLSPSTPTEATRERSRVRPIAAPKVELRQRLPSQTPLHQLQKVRAWRQRAALTQCFEVTQPHTIRSDELADKPKVIEGVGVDRGIPPQRDHSIGQMTERYSIVLHDHLGDGRTDAGAPRSRGEERSAMGGILHVVREGDGLVVVVVVRGVKPGPAPC